LKGPFASQTPAGVGSLRSAPSWLFSARKVLAQQDHQAAAQRLIRAAAGGSSGSNGGSNDGAVAGCQSSQQYLQGDQQRYVVVAGRWAGCGNPTPGILLLHLVPFFGCPYSGLNCLDSLLCLRAHHGGPVTPF
jgi:hypothetical protein